MSIRPPAIRLSSSRSARPARRPRRSLRACVGALLLACAALGGGCSSLMHDEQWQSMEAQYEVDFAILWEAVKLTLIEQFSTVEYERANEGILHTGWKEQLNYLAGAGVRERAFVNVRKADKGWAIRVRVEREANREPVRTLDPRYAKWERIDDNAARAQHMVGLVHIKLKAITES